MLWEKKESLATALIYCMSAYMEEAQQNACMSVPSIQDVRDAYKNLVNLGLGNTQNALMLKRQIGKVDADLKTKEIALRFISFIKEVQSHFGSKAIVVSKSQFDALLKKYKLTIGALNNYNGVIPIENIKDLQNVLDKISSFNYRYNLNRTSTGYLLNVESVRLQLEDEYIIRTFLKEHNNIIAVNSSTPNFDKAWWAQDVIGLDNLRWPVLSKLYGQILNNRTMLIACPAKYLNNPKVEISVNPVDPIIFQYTPYGPLIYTAWGEEAEDVVLKKYMEFNSKIASI